MKTFDQLTNSQKETAIEFAKTEIKGLLKMGIVNFGDGDGLSDKTIQYFAIAAAEGSFYTEKGDTVVEGIVE